MCHHKTTYFISSCIISQPSYISFFNHFFQCNRLWATSSMIYPIQSGTDAKLHNTNFQSGNYSQRSFRNNQNFTSIPKLLWSSFAGSYQYALGMYQCRYTENWQHRHRLHWRHWCTDTDLTERTDSTDTDHTDDAGTLTLISLNPLRALTLSILTPWCTGTLKYWLGDAPTALTRIKGMKLYFSNPHLFIGVSVQSVTSVSVHQCSQCNQCQCSQWIQWYQCPVYQCHQFDQCQSSQCVQWDQCQCIGVVSEAGVGVFSVSISVYTPTLIHP